MAENIFTSLDISSQGMSLQRRRLAAVAKNIANVNTTKGADGKPYQRETVVVREVAQSQFEREYLKQIQLGNSNSAHGTNLSHNGYPPDNDVIEVYTVNDNTPPRLIYEPGHPDAREDGYLEVPNINIVTEMVEMMTAQRAFEANTQVTEAAKNIAKYSLEI
ncbi:flagellar basal body rod protein FlgC [Candidatus Kapaibacterium sp.]